MKESDDPLPRDLRRRLVEPRAAASVAFRTHDSGTSQSRHYLLEHRPRHLCPLREFLELGRCAVRLRPYSAAPALPSSMFRARLPSRLPGGAATASANRKPCPSGPTHRITPDLDQSMGWPRVMR